MEQAQQTYVPSLNLVGRDDLPKLQTISSTTATQNALPGLATAAAVIAGTSTTESFSAPSMWIPSANGNPYISRTSQPSGTVFIAVGSVVAAILIIFALYHLFKSLWASAAAKKAVYNEKAASQKFAQNNNLVYGANGRGQQNAGPYSEYKGSVSKLPLMGNPQYAASSVGQFGQDSFSQSGMESDIATSRHDLTKMFISPTQEMSSNRMGTHTHTNSVANVSLYGRSFTDLNSTVMSNKRLSGLQNLYMNESSIHSQSDVSRIGSDVTDTRAVGDSKPRNPNPSMYLQDLIDS